MVYRSGFCANIKVDGKIIDDENGTVALPFGKEYAIRVKNKNTRDGVAQIYIDGRNVTEKGDLIVHSGDIVEIERYVENLNNGRKFKFVSLDDVNSSERDNPKNGIIEIRFRLTKEPVERIIYHHPIVEHYYYPRKIIHWNEYPYYDPPWTPNNWGTITKGTIDGITTTETGNINAFYCSNSSSTTLNNPSISCSNSCSNVSDVFDGKTVEGSYSGQRFNYSFIGTLEEKETIIRLKIVGYDEKGLNEMTRKATGGKYCGQCGKMIAGDSKFCDECGVRLI